MAEALVLIVAATVVRRVSPMPKWQGLLGRSRSVRDIPQPLDATRLRRPDEPKELDVYRSVRAAASRLPYDPRCLDRATAGQLMLRRRKHPGVVVIGLAKPSAEDLQESERWKAHAWLVGRSGAVTGGREAVGFVATSCFIPPELAR